MTRINIVWNKIWKIIRDHFSEVGLHTNNEIAKYSVHFLTKLSILFL